jgi:trehalose 6-phosphate phosphatase
MHWQTSPLLTELIRYSRLGLITDVDGTISHLVDQPDAARITPRSRELLAALRDRITLVAALSGRSARDVQTIVDLPGIQLIGNHGMEWWHDGRIEIAPAAAEYRPALEVAIEAVRAQHVPGVFVEDKGVTLAFHYRRAADPTAAAEWLAGLLAEIAEAHHLKLSQGNMIFELRPPVEINKGSAFRQLIESYHLDAAVYLGDDTTDLDALRMARQLRDSGACWAVGLGVASEHVPPAMPATADLMLSGVQEVETFLGWLLSNAARASST